MRNPKTVAFMLFLVSIMVFAEAGRSATLIQTMDTSQFDPPSPDTAGIAWLEHNDKLLASDSEVNEIPALFTGDNLYEIDYAPAGLVGTGSTIDYSDEPTGVGYNPANQHVFISDDDKDEIFEINRGADGLYGTDDDIITSFDTSAFGSSDPEGVAYSPHDGRLYIADGVDREVYIVDPGANGLFDGVPSKGGDDVVTSFDTECLGMTDIEGIACDSDHPGHLYLVGEPDDTVFHVTIGGFLVRTFGILQEARKPAGLTLAPPSLGNNDPNPGLLNLYITERGVDNNSDPDENDGKIYEYSVEGLFLSNQSPDVSAGPDRTLGSALPDVTVLNGTVIDDGLPDPPAQVTILWSQVSGPAAVTFEDPNIENPTVTFTALGEYVLRLTADDSELSTFDDVTVTVNEPAVFSTLYVSTSSTAYPPGISSADENIAAYDFSTGAWSVFFDGSDVGLGASRVDVKAFHINADGSILFAINIPQTLPDVGLVEEFDIVRFVPTSTGVNTAGTFEWYFDGSDVGLGDYYGEAIDAIGIAPDGRLLISTISDVIVDDLSQKKDEDLLAFTATQLGQNTSGTWELYFDGSDVELQSSGEDVNSVWIDDNGDIYLSFKGEFSVSSGAVTGDEKDILLCVPDSIGSSTSCTYSLFWDAQANGLTDGGRVSGISLSH